MFLRKGVSCPVAAYTRGECRRARLFSNDAFAGPPLPAPRFGECLTPAEPGSPPRARDCASVRARTPFSPSRGPGDGQRAERGATSEREGSRGRGEGHQREASTPGGDRVRLRGAGGVGPPVAQCPRLVLCRARRGSGRRGGGDRLFPARGGLTRGTHDPVLKGVRGGPAARRRLRRGKMPGRGWETRLRPSATARLARGTSRRRIARGAASPTGRLPGATRLRTPRARPRTRSATGPTTSCGGRARSGSTAGRPGTAPHARPCRAAWRKGRPRPARAAAVVAAGARGTSRG